MNANSKSRTRKNLVWPFAGIFIATLVSINPFYAPRVALAAGIGVWFIAMTIALILSANLIGARVGTFTAGVLLAVPCFVWASPLPRGLLMCFMGLPFAAAAALVLTPPIASLRGRLAYLCCRCGKCRVERRKRNFDLASLFQLVVSTVVLAAAIAVCKATSASGLWLLVRWLAGGILVFAFAEMATAGHGFLTAAVGISAPPFFQSPYRSVSVGEFWTKRWNLPASEMFHEFCFAPLARHGVWLALSAAFVVSAIAHVLLAYMAMGKLEVALICGAFFLVQPILITVERWLAVRRWRPAAARVWTLTVLAITSPLFVEPGLQIVEKSWGTPDNVLVPTVVVFFSVIIFCSLLSLASLASSRLSTEGHFLSHA